MAGTTSNASTQPFTNTSSSSSISFSYIIPYDQPQECNIYGPICQTGSITVGVNIATETTTTVLPCSSYLTEQSTYLLPDSLGSLYDMGEVPLDWMNNFGHSPECTSYAAEYVNQLYTISGCGDQDTVIGNQDNGAYPTQIPPAVVRRMSPYYNALCCGNCSLSASEVRLYYFPDSSAPNCEYNQTSNSSSMLSGQNRKRAHSLISNGSIVVTSGYTL